MKKRKFIVKKRTLVLVTLLTLGFAITAKADIIDGNYVEHQWLIPKVGYRSSDHGCHDWSTAESEAEVRQWARENGADIKKITDEDQRYRACVKKVCDLFTYDIKAAYAMPYLCIQYGKGVCNTYTLFTKALCDEVGISTAISSGPLNGVDHNMLLVTINGTQYHSDPANIDSGTVDVYQITPGYVEQYVDIRNDLFSIAAQNSSCDEFLERNLVAPAGAVTVMGRSGKYYYISQKDADDLDNDVVTVDYIKAKYGIE